MTGKEKGMPAVERKRKPREGKRMMELYLREGEREIPDPGEGYTLYSIERDRAFPFIFSGIQEFSTEKEMNGLTHTLTTYKVEKSSEREKQRYVRVSMTKGRTVHEDKGQKCPTCPTCSEVSMALIESDSMNTMQCRACLTMVRMTWDDMEGPESLGEDVNITHCLFYDSLETMIGTLADDSGSGTLAEAYAGVDAKAGKKGTEEALAVKELLKEMLHYYGIDPVQVITKLTKEEVVEEEIKAQEIIDKERRAQEREEEAR